MEAVRSELTRALQWLQDDSVVERHYQAAMLIRVAVLDYERRKVAQELDVVQALAPKLQYGAEHPVTLVAVEGLACLVADNPKSRVRTCLLSCQVLRTAVTKLIAYTKLSYLEQSSCVSSRVSLLGSAWSHRSNVLHSETAHDALQYCTPPME